ncbi:cytochrome d ubiquinol oxidase subunit I [Lactovum miscens]|uniref:Cytochrome d ubiquinol oxidase subunit I n=1 Tax=Lactovum miscens TaxID=190387 RepID=A0A841C932_9LACT|nr:cytochrome ubiquinol oxidase subunit I [Lactovum miscens]MBB5887899.1 cytochrome d ubiquinol oxidase subunit I [Lactovum miscens]
MTIVNLARFQFAMTTIFHFFFVPFSVGMIFMTFLLELIYVITGDEKWKQRTKFFGSIMLLSVAVGVVTGIIQEFQFGMNWSDYSRFVGDIFGAPLAIEALLAFFMESTFIGIWLFGWEKLGKKLHLATIFLTFLGSILSSIWILAANSWMQNPVGYKVVNGRATLTSFSALLTNPQTRLEFGHVGFGFMLTGGFAVAGISAFQMLKKRNPDFFRPVLRLGLLIALIGALANFSFGDQQMIEVKNSQPMKFAAAEGVVTSLKNPAEWALIGFYNTADDQEIFGIKVPYMLSLLTYHSISTKDPDIEGVTELNKELAAKYPKAAKEVGNNFIPPMNTLFWTFRIMAGISALMILLSAVGLFLTRKKSPWLYKSKIGLTVTGWFMYAPFIAITCGWLVTELGRYPWTVYGLFTIQDSVSPNVSVGSLLFSNIVYFLLFCGLGAVMVIYSVNIMRKNDIEAVEVAYAKLDPFSADAFKSSAPDITYKPEDTQEITEDGGKE